MPITRVNLRVVRRVVRDFLALPSARQKEIQKIGRGVFCRLIPGPLTRYSRDEYPELYEEKRPTLWHEGKQFIVIVGPFTMEADDRLSQLSGSIWIPFIVRDKPIEEYMS